MKKKRKIKQKPQTEEEDVYVRINEDNSAEAKKQLLEITASFIKLQMIYERIKDHGKKEIVSRNSAKRNVKMVSTLINKITSEMPKVKIPKEVKRSQHEDLVKEEIQIGKAILTAKEAMSGKKMKKGDKRSKKLTLNQELLEIKRKLANLS